MDYLDKNYLELDLSESKPILNIIGPIKNKRDELERVLGHPHKKGGRQFWKFKIDKSNFTVHEVIGKNGWFAFSDTKNEAKVKYFLRFLQESRSGGISRGVHTRIPDYRTDYQLKKKIALFHVPPVPPPNGVVLQEKKSIPRKNKIGEIIFTDYPDFKPNRTPKEVLQAGSFGGTYFRKILSGVTGKWYEDAWKEFPMDWFKNLDIGTHVTSQVIRAEVNKYGNKAGGNLDMWESSGWITEIDPYGWFQWYCRFYLGRRSTDDKRQIRRWKLSSGPTGRFRTKLFRQLIDQKAEWDDFSKETTGRQGLLHWGYEITKNDFDDFE